MYKPGFIVVSLILSYMGLAFGATEVELVNERIADGKKKAYTIKALFLGQKSRYTFYTEEDAKIGNGTYMLSLDGGGTVYYIDRNSNTCYHGSSEEVLEISSNFMLKTTDKFKLKIQEGEIRKVLEEDAGAIHGLPTKHTLITIGFTASYKYMLFNNKYKVKRVVDVWVTPKIAGINDQGIFQRAWEYTGDEELDQELRAIIGTGNNYRLRSEINQTMVDKKGKESSAQILQYVKSITEIDDLPEDAFRLPECKEIDAKKMEKNFKALLKALLK